MKEVDRGEQPRSTLGRYRVIDELGSGGMARVYLGLKAGLGGFAKLAVLKVMRRELAQNPEAVKLFLAEARLAARFNHPNVVQTTEVDEDAGAYFISMEYLEGLPLGMLLGKTLGAPLPLAARLQIACQLLDGLTYLHELSDLDGSPLGLVHRDISPSNVFVTFNGTVKLLDFGVAKASGVSEVSAVGTFKGKVAYAAPEQLKGHSDARSDIFTVGLLLWEILSYRRLWLERTHVEILQGRVLGADSELMRSRDPGMPRELLAICLGAAALNPEDRYQTASDLRDALRSYMTEHSLQFSAEQLRLLLTERFDVLRQSTRTRIDRRLKETQQQDDPFSAGSGARAHSQTPHAFADSSQRVSLGVIDAMRTEPRRLLSWAGASALVLAAAISGAFLVRGARRAAVFGSEAAHAAASVSPNLPSAIAVPSENGMPAAPFAHELGALADPTLDEHELESAAALDPAGAKSARRRADVQSAVRSPRRPPVEHSGSTSGDAPRSSSSVDSANAGRNEVSDFTHGRAAHKLSRPIDSSSPYSN